MEEKIRKYLADLEKEREIEILLACETGSRAWGFPSPDSDFDIRIIYKHHKEWYLSLIEEKDTIEYFLENNELDISGWDLRKCLRLLWKSNPPLIERIQSPIIYKVNTDFLNGINRVAQKTYSRISTIHHYLSMGKKAYEEVVSEDEYKLKKLFYALRSAIACVWILEKEIMPPIEFRIMLNQLNIPERIRERIDELIKIKSTISESYFHRGETDLIVYIRSCFERTEKIVQSLPSSNGHISELNDFFIKTLG